VEALLAKADLQRGDLGIAGGVRRRSERRGAEAHDRSDRSDDSGHDNSRRQYRSGGVRRSTPYEGLPYPPKGVFAC
ncbi:MAG: hypothetical protein M3310_00660, partial [Actinomycetota bacterium]|nr:hypothetical protein [Actinomycetota bacterium]